MPAPLAGIATLGFCAYLALYPALRRLAAGARRRDRAWARAAAGDSRRLDARWNGCAAGCSPDFPGSPWAMPQIDTPLAGYAPLGGVYAAHARDAAAVQAPLWCLASGHGRAQAAVAAGADRRCRRGAADDRLDRAGRRAAHACHAAAGQRAAGPEVRSGALRAHARDLRAARRTVAGAPHRPARDRVAALSRPGRAGLPRAAGGRRGGATAATC